MSDSLRRERLEHEQRLLAKQLEAKSLKLTCEGVRDLIRTKLDPYIEIEDLEVLVASEAMKELVKAAGKYHQLMADIENLKKDLGKE